MKPEAGLFSAVSQEEPATRRSVPGMPQGLGPTTIRSRLVRIDLDQLAAAQAIAARDIGASAALTLNLFDDIVVSAVVERTAPTLSGGYSLAGRLADSAFGTVTVVVNGAVVAGTVRTSGETYRIRTVGDGLYVLAQVDLSMLPPEAEPLVPPPGRLGRGTTDVTGDPARAAADDSAIDILIVYTPKARTAAGGPAEMEAQIDLVVAETNHAFADSDVSTRIGLVHTEAVNYTENGDLRLDLQRITDPDDGHMDDVHALRDTYGADFVHLITIGRLAGIAWLMTTVSQGFAPSAFGVTNQRSIGTFTHELGHNLGLRHDRYDDPGSTPYPYSHGYVNQRAFEPGAPRSARWFTIMAGGTQCRPAGFFCRRVFRFSNSRQIWNGDPMGKPGDASSSAVDGPADAARSLNETRTTSASFRPRATTATASLSPDPSSVVFLPDGLWHEFTVNASEPVEVVANTGGAAPRVSVAGSDISARACPPETAARVRSTGGRTIHLAACSLGTATVQLVRASDGTVLRNYVFEVLDRDIMSRERTALAALYDATGGPNWQNSTNWLSTEPIWTWHGVDTDAAGRVTKLALGDNGLTGSLPAELGDLASLEVLHLYYNSLTGPIPEALGKLPALWDLNLLRNQLAGPVPEALGDLSNLQWLTLAENQLTGSIPPALGNLPKLVWLNLWNNQLTGSIPAEWNPGLIIMGLSDNQLTGPIPEELGSVFNLRQLRLDNNSLSGPLPLSLTNLGLLEILWFDGNLSVCAPADAAFQAWLRDRDARGSTCSANRPPATVGTLPARELTVHGTLSLDVSQAFVDPDGDALIYRASSAAPRVVTAFAAGTRVFLNALSEGTAAIRVTASDPESLTATQSFLVTVRANRPPEPVGRLAPVTLAVDDAAVTVEMSGAFRDPDGDTLTYGVTSSAPGIASVVVFGSAVIVTPVSEGTATVTVSATDAGGSNTPATQAFTVMVSPPANRPPEPVGALAPLRTAVDGAPVTVDVAAAFRDPDGDTLTYGARSSAPGIASAVASGSAVIVTAVAEGTASVTVTATDPGRLSATQSFTVTVSPAANRPPEPVGALAPLRIAVDEAPVTVEVSVAFHDRDGDALAYGATSSSPGVASVSVSGSVVSVAPLSEGTSTVTVTARDTGGSNTAATQSFTVTVGAPANRPPVPVGVLVPLTIRVDEASVTVEVSSAFRDPDRDTLTYGATSSSPGVASVSVSGSTVTVAPVSEGTSLVMVTATDTSGSNTPATQRFSVTVSPPANRPPVPVGRLAPLTIGVDESSVAVEVSGAFRDPDGDTLTYGATSSSPGVASVSVSGSTVTVTPVSEGRSTVTVTATDTGGSNTPATQTFAVTVAPSANRPPVAVGTLAPLRVEVDEAAVTVDVSGAFRDPDGDALTYEAVSSAPGVATAAVSGSAVTVTPVAPGTSTVTVTATDTGGSNTPATQTFAVTVAPPANRPPVAVGTLAPLRVEVDEAAVTVDVSGAFRDPDGDALTYEAVSSAPGVATAAVSGSAVTVTPVAPGTSTVTVTATDTGGSNTAATQAFTVTVPRPFTDHPIVPGVTPVKAVHFTELRARIDVLRREAGLAPFPWTDRVLTAGVTPVRLAHLLELRSALGEAYAEAGRSAPRWTDAAPVGGATPIRAAHLMELRAAVTALE